MRVRYGMLLKITAVTITAAGFTAPVSLAQTSSPAADPSYSGPGELTSVAVISPASAWAVGTTAAGKPLIVRWNGRNWKPSRTPNLPGHLTHLNSVAAVSASSAWAVGTTGAGQALTLHWNGRTWKRIPSEISHAQLTGVAATSPRNAWAVGTSGNSVILHWNGKTWKRMPSPSPGGGTTLMAVAALTVKDAWAVGDSGAAKSVILHWNGKSWSRVASPSPGGSAILTGVAMTSAGNAWAVGWHGVQHTLALHWNGKSWKQVSTPSPFDPFLNQGSVLAGVTVVAANDAWAVGAIDFDKAQQRETDFTLILHWNGSRWAIAHSPNPRGDDQLDGVAASGPNTAWAVGGSGQGGPKSLTSRWNGKTWN
jgi:hypothetical protein